MIFRWFNGAAVGFILLLCGFELAAEVSKPPLVPPLPSDLPPPPPTPVTRSPVDFFRELLAMDGAERRLALTNRSAAVRERLLAKIREYQLMPPEQRELRLRATELRWHLVPLLKMPPAQRPALTTVPAHLRQLVADRLQQWDLLPPDAQRDFIENEAIVDYFTQAAVPDAAQQQRVLDSLPPARRQQLEMDMARWQDLSASERQKTFERVNRFFDLTPKEQEKALTSLSRTEREQMEKTLRAFEKLPREQRIQCIRSFGKFAGLSAAERQQFLQNAARWGDMTPSERETWRDLVRKLPEMPPLPPDFRNLSPPPLPPPRAAVLVTNGN